MEFASIGIALPIDLAEFQTSWLLH